MNCINKMFPKEIATLIHKKVTKIYMEDVMKELKYIASDYLRDAEEHGEQFHDWLTMAPINGKLYLGEYGIDYVSDNDTEYKLLDDFLNGDLSDDE